MDMDLVFSKRSKPLGNNALPSMVAPVIGTCECAGSTRVWRKNATVTNLITAFLAEIGFKIYQFPYG
jgi:hypothetical protein